MKTPTVVIAGPTASGKSLLALDLAKHFKGIILNGDSLQIFKGLPLLTAKPPQQALKEIPHFLYDLLSETDVCSVAKWQGYILKHIHEALISGTLPFVVGGTGMYLNSLSKGLSLIPEISPHVRLQARNEYQTLGYMAFYERLTAQDPNSLHLKPTDKHRCMRAWEVLLETGLPLSEWQKNPNRSAIEHLHIATILLLPDRKQLYDFSAQRFKTMLTSGVIEEIKEFNNSHSHQSHSLSKAVGYRELSSYLEGKLNLDEAIALCQQATRRYIKRQYTWFRHQVKEACVINSAYTADTGKTQIFQKARNYISNFFDK